MSKLTLADLANLQNEATTISTINNNNALIETALENTLSRDGTSPNTMAASLDMNSNYIINLPSPTQGTHAVTKSYGDDNYGGTAATNAANSADEAETSATNAANSASAAATSATNAANSATNAATSATAAATSATEAATSATSAASSATTSANNATVIAGGRWNFDSDTSMADPGTGEFRFNHATVSSVTAIAIDDLSSDTGNPDLSNYLLTWDDSSNTVKGQLIIRKLGTPATFAVFNITALTDNVGWTQFTVSHVASNGTWSAADQASFQFARAGDAGNMSGPGTSVDSEIALFNGTSGNTLKRATTTGLLKASSGVLAQAVAGTDYYNPGGTDVAIADGGTGASTAAAAFSNLKQDATETATGVVELATDAETQTGTDTTRAITPANLTAKEATAAQYRANTADRILTTDQVWSAAGLVSLTDGATITPDFSTGINFTVTLGGNRTLANPTNAKAGQAGVIIIKQDGTGSRTLSFGTNWMFANDVAPTLTTTASRTDLLHYFCESSTIIHASLVKDSR